MNRDHILRMMADQPGALDGIEDRPEPEDVQELGVPESALTTGVDVRDFAPLKRAAMAAHASQIGEQSFFLQMPEDAFRESFGWEWYIRRGVTPGLRETTVFDGLDGRNG